MTQPSLPMLDDEADRESDTKFRRAVGAALDLLKLDTFCKEHGFEKSDVSKGRNGERQWQQRWTRALLRHPRLSDDIKADILRELCGDAGMEPVKPRPPALVPLVFDFASEVRAELGAAGDRLVRKYEPLMLAAIAARRWQS